MHLSFLFSAKLYLGLGGLVCFLGRVGMWGDDWYSPFAALKLPGIFLPGIIFSMNLFIVIHFSSLFFGKICFWRILSFAFCLLSVDLVALLQKPVPPSQAPEVNSFEASQQQSFGQALVFTNSQHNSQMAPGTGGSAAVNSYPPQSLVTHFSHSVRF